MKRKSKLMLGISALVLAAGAVGATGTFAWFAASGNPTAAAVAGSGTITCSPSDVTVAGYSITVTPDDIASIQLTNAVDAGGSKFKLQYGGVTGGKAVVADCTTATGFVSEVTFTASWVNAPTQDEDIAYFKNKRLTGGAFTTTGQAKLMATSGYNNLSDSGVTTGGVYYIDISNDNDLTLTVVATTLNYVRIQASSTDASGSAASAEGAHSDTIAVTAKALTVGAKGA